MIATIRVPKELLPAIEKMAEVIEVKPDRSESMGAIKTDIRELVISRNTEETPCSYALVGDGYGAQNGFGGYNVCKINGKVISTFQEFGCHTNNYRELIAINHAVKAAMDMGVDVIYSDSLTAISWIQHGQARTKDDVLALNKAINETRQLMVRYGIKLKKWRTELWGEIPADANRK